MQDANTSEEMAAVTQMDVTLQVLQRCGISQLVTVNLLIVYLRLPLYLLNN